MPDPKQLRPDHHILGEARELLAEAEDDGLVQSGAARKAHVLDGSAYEIEWADEDAEKLLERRGTNRQDNEEVG